MLLLEPVGTAASSLLYHVTAGRSWVSDPGAASAAVPNVPVCVCCAGFVRLLSAPSFRQTALKAVLCSLFKRLGYLLTSSTNRLLYFN